MSRGFQQADRRVGRQAALAAAVLLLATAAPGVAFGGESDRASATVRLVIPPRVSVRTFSTDTAGGTAGACASSLDGSARLQVVDDTGASLPTCGTDETEVTSRAAGIRRLTVTPV